MSRKINIRGQEEMVGFALIIIIVAIILLVFLGFYLTRPNNQTVESYEAQSFVQSMLQTSSQCQSYFGYVPVKALITMCSSGSSCNDGNYSCTVLNSTLEGILSNSWAIGQGSPVRGYSLNISSITGSIFELNEGNITSNSEGTSQNIPDSNGNLIPIVFSVHY